MSETIVGRRGNKVLPTKISEAIYRNRRLLNLEVNVEGYSSSAAVNSVCLSPEDSKTLLDHYSTGNPNYLVGKVVRCYYNGHTLVGFILNGQ